MVGMRLVSENASLSVAKHPQYNRPRHASSRSTLRSTIALKVALLSDLQVASARHASLLLSLGYPLLTENVVDHIIYKFTRSDYVSHKHREERAAYFFGELKLSRATEAAKDEDATEDAAIGEAAVTGPACDQATACEPADHREPDYPEPDHTELDYSLTTDPISGKPIEPGARLVMKLNAELDTEKALPAAARSTPAVLAPRVYGSVYGVGTSGGGTSGGGTSGAWEDDNADGAASKNKKSRLEGDGAAAQDSADDVEV